MSDGKGRLNVILMFFLTHGS